MDTLTAADFAAILFSLLNGLRVLAYVPQILKIAHDRHGAEAISCTTWLIFALSHLSTVFYAVLVASDGWMAWIFATNLIACIGVLGLTVFKRSLLTLKRVGGREPHEEKGDLRNYALCASVSDVYGFTIRFTCSLSC